MKDTTKKATSEQIEKARAAHRSYMDMCGHKKDAAPANEAATNGSDKKTFADLLHEYEEAATSGSDSGEALYRLAYACALSVVNKCIDPQRKTAKDVSQSGQNKTMIDVKRSIIKDGEALDSLGAANKMPYEIAYNKDGDAVVQYDKAALDAINTLSTETLGDGFDLVHTAVVAILDESAKCKERGDSIDLETRYNKRRLKVKVYIKRTDSAAWETVETAPISEIYRAVRRDIANSRAVQTDARNGYLYLSDVVMDEESDTEEIIYRRMPKYYDVSDCDGRFTTTNETICDDMEALVAALNLTAKQSKILQLKQSGYGYKAIGTYLGIRPDSVRDTFKAIRKKAIQCGVFDQALIKRYAE